MKWHRLLLLGVAVVAVAAGLALGSDLAAAKTNATNPCSGLSGTVATRCQQAVAAYWDDNRLAIRNLFQDLECQGALTRNNLRIVKWMNVR